MTSANVAKGKILCAEVELRLSAAGERTLFLAIPGADVVTLSSVSDIEKKTKRREIIKALAKACNQDDDALWTNPDVHENVILVVHELAARLGVVTAPKASKDGGERERLLETYKAFMQGKGLKEEPYVIEHKKSTYVVYNDGNMMGVLKIVERYSDDGGVSVDVEPVYVGPVIKRTKKGAYLFYLGGKLWAIALSLDEAVAVLKTKGYGGRIEHPHPSYPYLDALLPNDDALRNILNNIKWETDTEGVVDWVRGIDYNGVMRTDTPPQEAAKMLERRQEVLKTLGPNYEAALALETLYIARPLADYTTPGVLAETKQSVYLYGPAKRGKTTFLTDVVEMFIPCLKRGSPLCEKFGSPPTDYYVYNPVYTLSQAQMRNVLDIEGPPVIIDEVDAKTVASIARMLGIATGTRVGIQAARHGRGVIGFQVRRGVFFASNDAFELVKKHLIKDLANVGGRVSSDFLPASERRFIVLRWEDHVMTREEVKNFLAELYEATPAMLPLISDLLQNAKNELRGWDDLVDLAIKMCETIERRYGVNLKPRIEVLRKLMESGYNLGAVREIEIEWAGLYETMREKYKVATPYGALARLISDQEYVYYQKRVKVGGSWEPAVRLWKNVFKYRVDVEVENVGDRVLTRIEIERRVAYGLFGWDWPQDLAAMYDNALNGAMAAGQGEPTSISISAIVQKHEEWLRASASHHEQIELIKAVAQRIEEGEYPLLRASGLGRTPAKYLGVERDTQKEKVLIQENGTWKIVYKPVHVYNVVPLFFKYVLGALDEEQEDEEISTPESEDVKSKAFSPFHHVHHGNAGGGDSGETNYSPVGGNGNIDISQNQSPSENLQMSKNGSFHPSEPHGENGEMVKTLNALQTEKGNGAAGQTSNAAGGVSNREEEDVKSLEDALDIIRQAAKRKRRGEEPPGGP